MDMTTIFVGIIILLAAVISMFLIPWLRAKVETERAAAGVDYLEQLTRIARMAVLAAEQMKAAGLLSGEKLEYALGVVEDALKAQGIVFDTEIVAAAVEAVVRDMKVQGEVYVTLTPSVTMDNKVNTLNIDNLVDSIASAIARETERIMGANNLVT